MKKLDYLIIFIVILLSVAFYYFYFNTYKINANDELYVEVLYKNDLLKKVHLTKDTHEVINIDRGGHHNQVTITYESIRMTEADCPDKYCIRMFMNYRNFTPIICTNGVVVRIVGQAFDSDVDIIVP